MFRKQTEWEDKKNKINNREVPSLATLFEFVNWKELANGIAGRFHGDFHFENILVDDNMNFTFIDWRQDFCGGLEIGDIYYDLAKLLHGLIISHSIVANEQYSVSWENDEIRYDIQRSNTLVNCEQYLKLWCMARDYSWSKIRTLTSLIYLNIAALHHYPYNHLLYAIGKDMLANEVIKEK